LPASPGLAAPADEELTALMALAPVGVIGWHRSGAIVHSNAVIQAWLGRVPVSAAELPEALLDLLGIGEGPPPGGGTRERNGWVILPGGARLHMRTRVRYLRSSGGERCIAVVEDRSVEDERDQARLEMGALMETADVGVATFDTAHGWLDGVASSHAQGPSATAGAAAHQPRRGRAVVAAGLRTAAACAAPWRTRRGALCGAPSRCRRRWLLTRVEPGALSEGRAALSVVTRDVTEQELAQRRNERLLRELQTILEASAAGIAFFRAGHLVRCNRRFEGLLGIAAGAADGATLESLVRSVGARPTWCAKRRSGWNRAAPSRPSCGWPKAPAMPLRSPGCRFRCAAPAATTRSRPSR
jgi:PAS domain-containing protein